jgi:hypothetical protein
MENEEGSRKISERNLFVTDLLTRTTDTKAARRAAFIIHY